MKLYKRSYIINTKLKSKKGLVTLRTHSSFYCPSHITRTMMIENSIRYITRIGRPFLRSMASSYPLDKNSQNTGLHKIEEMPKDPFDLFKKWYHEHQTENHISSNSFCLSTAAKNGRVSARNLILRRLDDDGFVIMTDSRSKKARDIAENPQVAMTFLWVKMIDDLILARQVRAEGKIEELNYEDWREIYEKEPLFAKLRAHVCHQGHKVEWEKAKQHHDDLLQQYKEGVLDIEEKPDHVVAYKMTPDMVEFYESLGPRIADRAMYLKGKRGWENPERICA